MIDPSFDNTTTTAPTYEELRAELDIIKNDREFWQTSFQQVMAQIRGLEEYITDNFDYIDPDVVQNITEIFGFEITREYDVQITVTFSGTVKAPLGFDMDELEGHLDALLNTNYYNDGVEIDVHEDNMEIDWSES